MATTRLMPLHPRKDRTEAKSIGAVIEYVINPRKTEQGELITSYACEVETVAGEFMLAKREYLARTGRHRGKDDVIGYHLRQSFLPGEVTAEEANRIGQELAMRFTHGNHAFIVATHTDRHHLHNHIIFHSINLDCDRKFRNFWGSSLAIRRLSDTLCIQHGLSIVETPKRHGKSYNKWLSDQAKPTHRDVLRDAIDMALMQRPADFDALLDLLRAAGWKTKLGKRVSLHRQDQKRFIRLDTLGDDYSEEKLRVVLAGKARHTPHPLKQKASAPEKQVNMLVDIQAKLQAGKGAGYERWAKVFNLKQMAQTLNYLSEHGLLDYADLEKQTVAATARFNELSETIHDAEARMSEIAALKAQIINYVKTRETYAAYRKAGYSKQYLAAHEQEILLHKAAKKAFDELGIKKLPTIKALQEEYTRKLAQKKTAYGEYRKARDEMRQILTVKANVDSILGKHDPENEREVRLRKDR